MAPESFASVEEEISFLNGYLAAFAALNSYVNHVSSFTLEICEKDGSYPYELLPNWREYVRAILKKWLFENVRFNSEIMGDDLDEQRTRSACVSEILSLIDSLAARHGMDSFLKFPEDWEPNQSEGVFFTKSADEKESGFLLLLNHWD